MGCEKKKCPKKKKIEDIPHKTHGKKEMEEGKIWPTFLMLHNSI